MLKLVHNRGVPSNWLMEGCEPLHGIHHGRLAIEQTYGYMVFDQVVYGIMSTFNSFVFLKRNSPGVLHMSRMIPNASTTPTIMKLLYYFSHLCALAVNPHPELDSEGNAIHLSSAPKTAEKAPKIPDPNYVRPPQTKLRSVNLAGTPRRSPRFPDSSDNHPKSLCLDISNLTFLGCKGWRGTLNTGVTVFAKLWDGWKFSGQYSEHEASIYHQLRNLWGTTVPEFIGLGVWGFSHILLLSFIEVLPVVRRIRADASVQCYTRSSTIQRLRKTSSWLLKRFMRGKWFTEMSDARISLSDPTTRL